MTSAMVRDLQYAYRTLRQNPGFALTAILSIALAIGTNSAIFSFQDGLLLRPLAVESPSTLVTVNSRSPSGAFEGFSYPEITALRDKTGSFDGLAPYRLIPAGVARDERAQPEFKAGLMVSGNFFSVLGVKPYLGRGFRSDEDAVPGRDAVVVLAHDLWRELGADPSIVGRHIRLGRAGGLDFTVVGVAPESFTGMDLFIRPAFYIPIMMGPRALGVSDEAVLGRGNLSRDDSFYVKARLKAGASIPGANADLAALAKALEQADPGANRGRSMAVRTEMQSRLDATPILGGVTAVVFVLMLVILLIACANVMNLMLVRGRARAREIAIRASVGASRLRLIRQLMAESLIISIAGGAAGLLMAQPAADFFSNWELPGDVSAKFAFQVDGRVLIFTFVVAVVSALLFGLAPAFRSARTDLTTALKAGEWTDGRRRLFGRNALVMVQVAGSILLLVTAAQMYRNTTRALQANPGFAVDHRLTVRVDPSMAGYTPAQTEQFYDAMVEKARAAAGVKSAAVAAGLPFTTNGLALNVVPEGYEFPRGQDGAITRGDAVDDRYFETFHMRIMAGRAFSPADRADSLQVAIVNDAFAKRFFGGNAIGKRIQIPLESKEWMQIVGVAATGKYQSMVEPPSPFVYLPIRQHPRERMTLIVETAGDAASMAPVLRELIRSLDPNVPIVSVRTMQDVVERNGAAPIHIFDAVFIATGVMGFLLALVGLYAVVSYQVQQRKREIGIRITLGAERPQIMRMVLRQAAAVAGAGVVIGLTLSLAARPVLLASVGQTSRPGVLSGFDAASFGLLPLALLLITLAAAAIPARRASNIDPQRALKED